MVYLAKKFWWVLAVPFIIVLGIITWYQMREATFRSFIKPNFIDTLSTQTLQVNVGDSTKVTDIISPKDLGLAYQNIGSAFLITPDIDKKLPVIVIIPDFEQGLTSLLIRAKQLGKLGYYTLLYQYPAGQSFTFGINEKDSITYYLHEIDKVVPKRKKVFLSIGIGAKIIQPLINNIDIQAIILQNPCTTWDAWLQFQLENKAVWCKKYILNKIHQQFLPATDSLFDTHKKVLVIADQKESYFLSSEATIVYDSCHSQQKSFWLQAPEEQRFPYAFFNPEYYVQIGKVAGRSNNNLKSKRNRNKRIAMF